MQACEILTITGLLFTAAILMRQLPVDRGSEKDVLGLSYT